MKFEIEVQKQFTTGNLILKFITGLKEPEKLTNSSRQVHRALLEGYWKTFSERHPELSADKNYASSNYNQRDFYSEVQKAYLEAQILLCECLPNSTTSPAHRDSEQVQPTPGRLPKISLPTFSGDYLAWENFRDLFTALVHEAPGLSNATRLQYLKTSLTGEAAKILRGVPVTDANYQGAWDALVKRFDNKRILLFHHLNHLLSLPSMTSETASELKSLLDSTTETRRALENLGRPVQYWDDWFVHCTILKLESNLRKDWENSNGGKAHLPTFDELSEFLSTRIASLDTVASGKTIPTKTSISGDKRFKIRSHSTTTQPSNFQNCALCKKAHFISYCPDFKQKTVPQRWKLIPQLKLCANCLRGHPTGSCRSIHRCNHCGANHHTMLHENSSNSTTSSTQSISTSHAQTGVSHPTLLATALVKVSSQSGRSATVRALLDQGSEVTFISENLTQQLRLPRTKTLIPVTGISSSHCGTVKSLVQIQLSHPEDKQSSSIPTQAFVLPRLTKVFRPSQINPDYWPHLRNFNFSDLGPNSSHHVDLVIGADLYGHILLDGLIKGPLNAPVAQNTIFGWVLSGRLDQTHDQTNMEALASFHCAVDTSLVDELRRFWEIEEVQQRSTLTPEENECEEHFKRTHTRAADGRFIVRLPQRSNVTLGRSYSAALRSLQRSESRRQHDEDLDQAYRTFMKEYIDLGHMSPVLPAPNSDRVYLPHHAVWKTDGQSKKIRVVFNASACTSSGHTLNDSLLPGPKLQQELSHVLLRWRKHAVVFTADIVKMFRQIWVHPEDRSLQQILWRDSPHQEIQEFQLNTVTYGTASAPYLAIRCLLQLASEEAQRLPEAAKVIKAQTYVDDILAGAETLEDARRLKEELKQLLMAGGFELAKWSSNSPELVEDSASTLPLSDGSIKTLGLQWHPESDTFKFLVTLEAPKITTKRTILSCIAKLFDPLGWLAPVLISAKLYLQDLWTSKSDWDAALPASLEESWNNYYSSLQILEKIRIPRWVSLHSNCSWEIHGFCDASQRAYAAAVYIRVKSIGDNYCTQLLTAKTKVAPIKVVSLPRLELCGAVLLAKLLHQVVDVFEGAANIYAWTDSQVVLCWLQAHPSKWKCFVANRTSEIHQLIPNAIWRHVPSRDNAADPASRGIPAEQLVTEDLWWNGPSWLSRPNSYWPATTSPQTAPTVQEEENPRSVLALTTTASRDPTWSLQSRYSSYSKLIRVTAWMLRFIRNAKITSSQRIFGTLTTVELRRAQQAWIRICQAEAYPDELKALASKEAIPRKSSLSSLRPFLDTEGLLRVGGRLEHSLLDYGEKHPYVLPARCNFSKLVVLDAHHRVLHGGPQLTLSHLSRRFWVVRGRRLVKDVIHSCVRCCRHNAKIEPPLMGQLPMTRVTPSRPFQHTGLDYAGPIQIRTTKGRGHKSYKGYIALFVCMATKAVHIEAVTDYTSEGFIAAFKRFSSRRGIPSTLCSDQATNFRGADAELQRLLQRASAENQRVAELLANDGTQWNFIPPHSPHFGGLWEAGVRSVKHHLRRVIGDHTLTFEELTTLLAEIEACLNSRPLTPLSSAAQDYAALTPGHFLIGSPLKTLPEPSLLDTNESRLQRWQLLRRLYEQFWRRWSTEYLQGLQQRTKWTQTATTLKINDLVLVKEDNLPPSKWCLGRVLQLHPGSDGIVRVVTIRTATSELRRPVVKLCRLPIQ